MIEVRLVEEFDTPAAAAAFLQALGGLPATPARQVDVTGENAVTPQKRPRKSKATETTEAPQTGAGGAAADPLAGILAAQAPVMQAPAVAAPPQVQVAPVEQPKPTELKDLLAAFTQLGQKKGRDAIAKVLGELGAQAVVGPPGVGIAQDKWALALAKINQALAA